MAGDGSFKESQESTRFVWAVVSVDCDEEGEPWRDLQFYVGALRDVEKTVPNSEMWALFLALGHLIV